jgi:hypothetical protein
MPLRGEKSMILRLRARDKKSVQQRRYQFMLDIAMMVITQGRTKAPQGC